MDEQDRRGRNVRKNLSNYRQVFANIFIEFIRLEDDQLWLQKYYFIVIWKYIIATLGLKI